MNGTLIACEQLVKILLKENSLHVSATLNYFAARIFSATVTRSGLRIGTKMGTNL